MSEYKLIIVDDEPWIREGIRDMADWNCMGITHVIEAQDGEEGLAMIDRHKPDIIITDIRMPCISGLDIIQNVRKKNNLTKVIIISGYDDFQYAQKAVELGAVCYILKPLEEQRIIEAVQKCIDQLEQENKRIFNEQRLRKQVEECLPLLKERYLNDMLSENEKDIELLEELESFKHKEKRKIIKEIAKYIDVNYRLDLSLNTIAEQFFLNASYLSNLFKDEMGETFTNYLMNIRIEKSKQLLKNVTFKVYQVSSMVGYEDEKYYARIFKRIVGMTPIQYREHIY